MSYETKLDLGSPSRGCPTEPQTQTDGAMPDWYPENTEGFTDFHGENLPPVVDDDGTRYADNIYTLSIMAGGQQFFNRSFTKAAFASRLSNEFRQQGILDGMMFDNSLPGLTFAVSVSMPQSDMVEPLLLKVDRQGGIAIERDERSDADLDDTNDEGV